MLSAWVGSEIVTIMEKNNDKVYLTSAIGLFGKSYALVRKNLNSYAIVYAIPAAITIAAVIQLIADSQQTGWNWGQAFSSSIYGPDIGSDTTIHGFGAALGVFLFFGWIVSYLLAVILNLRASEEKNPTFASTWSELWKNWLWLKMIGLFILSTLITIAGLILLVVPGVILLWRLFLAPYILIDKKTKVMDALSQSWGMTKGYAWPIYSVILLGFILSLSGVIPIVGRLVAFLFSLAYAAAPALRYQEIKKQS